MRRPGLLSVVIPLHACLAAGKEPAVPPVPGGHPRVYLRPADLPKLRAKVKLAEFAEPWRLVRESKRSVCRAFTYLITGDETLGRTAVESALRGLKHRRDTQPGKFEDGRPFHNPMHHAACVYDWCYDLLTPAEKQEFVREFKKFFADDHARGYPPDAWKLNPVAGHDSEGCIMSNLLPAGLAVYDEDPELYELAAKIFFNIYIEPRAFHYAAHMHHQGIGYFGARFIHDQATSWLFRRIGAGDVLPADQRFVPYHALYALCPDKRLLKMGDHSHGLPESVVARMTGAYYRDPYLLRLSEIIVGTPWHKELNALFTDLLFLEPGIPRAPLSELPLTHYFPAPMGEMIARTGWDFGPDSRTAVVHMRIGGFYFGNHQHRDFGTFQIYYRGRLANDTGEYQLSDDSRYGSPHWRCYYQHTLAHNGLMIFDPATAAGDFGGQRTPAWEHPQKRLQNKDFHWARVTAHAFGPDARRPAYSHIAGDITQAYSTGKVSRVTRSMVTLNASDASYPAHLIVFDDVVSRSPDFKKAWYLHCIQEPQVEGRRTTIIRDQQPYKGRRYDGNNGIPYSGQLVVETLLPDAVRIDKVGGPEKDCWNDVTQTNHTFTPKQGWDKAEELGAWRIEAVPTKPAKQHLFLNVLTVMDKGTPAPAVTQIESEQFAGARTPGHAVLFSRTGSFAGKAAFRIPGTQGVSLLICGLEPGAWLLTGPDGRTRRTSATAAGKCLYVETAAGQHQLRRD
ncbi:MAG: heparinase II/III family protein [Kiritimatiellae bacterium]|nr:heparinase II/III family protein [Kiritimatiellia bacterium]